MKSPQRPGRKPSAPEPEYEPNPPRLAPWTIWTVPPIVCRIDWPNQPGAAVMIGWDEADCYPAEVWPYAARIYQLADCVGGGIRVYPRGWTSADPAPTVYQPA